MMNQQSTYFFETHSRHLKGGGGGGGGGGGAGGGGAGGCPGPGTGLLLAGGGNGLSKRALWGILLGCVGINALLFFLLLEYCRHVGRQKKAAFRQAVAQATTHVNKSILEHGNNKGSKETTTSSGPISGRYKGEYYERGHGNVESVTNLQFNSHLVVDTPAKFASSQVTMDYNFSLENQPHWTVVGDGKDADGEFTITRGCVAPNGEAFWIERQGARHILVRGAFRQDRFYGGTWHASNGITGEFTRFVLIERSIVESPRLDGVVDRPDTETVMETSHGSEIDKDAARLNL